jgi:hypothetical protein
MLFLSKLSNNIPFKSAAYFSIILFTTFLSSTKAPPLCWKKIKSTFFTYTDVARGKAAVVADFVFQCLPCCEALLCIKHSR